MLFERAFGGRFSGLRRWTTRTLYRLANQRDGLAGIGAFSHRNGALVKRIEQACGDAIFQPLSDFGSDFAASNRDVLRSPHGISRGEALEAAGDAFTEHRR